MKGKFQDTMLSERDLKDSEVLEKSKDWFFGKILKIKTTLFRISERNEVSLNQLYKKQFGKG